jgi:hypothetical protein
MFEQLSQLAKQTATRASRRQFLGRVGRGALAAAMAMGGLLARGADAHSASVRICEANSDLVCKGRAPGSTCRSGRRTGICVPVAQGQNGAPSCNCFLT